VLLERFVMWQLGYAYGKNSGKVPTASEHGTRVVPNDKSGARSAAPVRRGGRARILRIIGGSWRGRKLRFPASSDLRPTPDRVRETLFNWLAGAIEGARCLDLFAGSGALGLEALSRGARHVTFIERDGVAVRELRARLSEWGAAGAGEVRQADALGYLAGGAAQSFDIVFLDPPFAAGLLGSAAALLSERGWLAPRSLLYLESAARETLPALPKDWRMLRAKRAGEVGYHLFSHDTGSPV
jgi:16S rRNA (guanine966-N2)-methyltransferase